MVCYFGLARTLALAFMHSGVTRDAALVVAELACDAALVVADACTLQHLLGLGLGVLQRATIGNYQRRIAGQLGNYQRRIAGNTTVHEG